MTSVVAWLTVGLLLGAAGGGHRPFDLQVVTLPGQFKGDDIHQLVVSLNPKGEFESSPQYAARIGSITEPTQVFAALCDAEFVRFEYDADRQVFVPELRESHCVQRRGFQGTEIFYALQDDSGVAKYLPDIHVALRYAAKIKGRLAVVVAFSIPRSAESSPYARRTPVYSDGRMALEISLQVVARGVLIFDRETGKILGRVDYDLLRASREAAAGQYRVDMMEEKDAAKRVAPLRAKLAACEALQRAMPVARRDLSACADEWNAFEAACKELSSASACRNPPERAEGTVLDKTGIHRAE